MTIRLNFGTFEINSNEFTKIEGNDSIYWMIAANSIKEAYVIRKERIPKITERAVYWEIRTSGDDIIGRDILGDYDDIVSEPDVLDEIRQNNLAGVKKWLEYGLNPNCLTGRPPNLFTPLILSCQYGYFEIIKLLIENGADVNMVGNPMYKTTALLETSRQGNPEIFKYLLDKGADINYTDAGGYNARLFAENFKHSEILKMINSRPQVKFQTQLERDIIREKIMQIEARDKEHSELLRRHEAMFSEEGKRNQKIYGVIMLIIFVVIVFVIKKCGGL